MGDKLDYLPRPTTSYSGARYPAAWFLLGAAPAALVISLATIWFVPVPMVVADATPSMIGGEYCCGAIFPSAILGLCNGLRRSLNHRNGQGARAFVLVLLGIGWSLIVVPTMFLPERASNWAGVAANLVYPGFVSWLTLRFPSGGTRP